MVYGIMPTQLGSISSRKYPKQPGALFSLLTFPEVIDLLESKSLLFVLRPSAKGSDGHDGNKGSAMLSFDIFLQFYNVKTVYISNVDPESSNHDKSTSIHICSTKDKMTCSMLWDLAILVLSEEFLEA